MTLTADRPARANSEGDPCPPWCVTDHAKYHNFHGAEQVRVEVPQYSLWSIRAVKSALTHDVTIEVAGIGMANVFLREASELARIIEGLADATPEQHRELSAAIRQAAAVITEADGG